MTSIAKYRNSKWLKKEDVESMDRATRCTTVERITEEEVGEEAKPVIHLKGIAKAWPLNMTALEALSEMADSDDTDDFAGLDVEIYVDPDVRYAGKKVGGIKLRSPQKATTNDAPFDDDVPNF